MKRRPNITIEECQLLAKACAQYAEYLDVRIKEVDDLKTKVKALKLKFTLTGLLEVFHDLKEAKEQLAKLETRGLFGERESAMLLAKRFQGLTENHGYHSANATSFYLRHLHPSNTVKNGSENTVKNQIPHISH
jgi:hypothetical protein